MKLNFGMWKNLHQEQSGQDLIEYALVAALIALAAVAGMKNVGNQLGTTFTAVSSSLTSALG